jgi:hypothetical protein
MSNKNGNGQHEWEEKEYNVRFKKLFGSKISDEVMAEDLAVKAEYDLIDQAISKIEAIKRRLRRKNALLHVRSKER